MKYRKKPVVIDAIQYKGAAGPILDFLTEEEAGLVAFAPAELPQNRSLAVTTLEGVMTCKYGCYLIRGIKGELYPCDPEIFEATYEKVENP